MPNLTEERSPKTIQEMFCTTSRNDVQRNIFIPALNIPLSITAFLGNVLIIVALQKVSSLHPPSKLLLRCLASTDLCVGLITQPLFVTYVMSPEHYKRCYYAFILSNTIGGIFCGVSVFTLTAISVDRLLALLMGLRYRHVVTLRRVWVLAVTSWLSCTSIVMILYFYSFRTAAGLGSIGMFLSIVVSTVCYTKIYLKLRHHQTQVQDHVQQGQPNGGEVPLNIARYRKTVSSALWLQMTLLACYLPSGIVTAVLAITGLRAPSHVLATAWDITLSLLYLNSSINPILYCWKIREVRQAVKNTIRQFCSC